MDIRDWPLNKIMQLPDWCFGRRWPIGLTALLGSADPEFDIAEAALPEAVVIWHSCFTTTGSFGTVDVNMGLALGDSLPANDAQWAQLELVFGGVVGAGDVRGSFHVQSGSSLFVPVRTVVATAGRRIVARFIRVTGATVDSSCMLVISSIPKEVPDWLLCR